MSKDVGERISKGRKRHDRIKNIIKEALEEAGIEAETEVVARTRYDVVCTTEDGTQYVINVDRSQPDRKYVTPISKLKKPSTRSVILRELNQFGGEAKTGTLERRVVDERNICCRRTFFRYLNKLEDQGEIERSEHGVVKRR